MNITLERLKEIIEYLKTNPKIEYNPYPEYDAKVYDLLHSLGFDDQYMSNYELIGDKEISKMSIEEVKTMLSFIVRGERFCDGHIASYIENGSLFQLANRELDLLTKK